MKKPLKGFALNRHLISEYQKLLNTFRAMDKANRKTNRQSFSTVDGK